MQRRHTRQSSGRQRPVSTGALGTGPANTTQNSSPGVNTRNSVAASTPPVPSLSHPQTQSSQPGTFTVVALQCYNTGLSINLKVEGLLLIIVGHGRKTSY